MGAYCVLSAGEHMEEKADGALDLTELLVHPGWKAGIAWVNSPGRKALEKLQHRVIELKPRTPFPAEDKEE